MDLSSMKIYTTNTIIMSRCRYRMLLFFRLLMSLENLHFSTLRTPDKNAISMVPLKHLPIKKNCFRYCFYKEKLIGFLGIYIYKNKKITIYDN